MFSLVAGNEHNIYKDEETKTHFEFGDDIPESVSLSLSLAHTIH